jgi:hypothetical protein
VRAERIDPSGVSASVSDWWRALFRQVRFSGELNIHNNFRTFGSSIQLLIRALTGENWPVS